MKGNWDDAITDFSRAIQLEPTNALAYFSRGSSYRAKDEFDKAIGDFNQSLKLNPTNGLAFSCRAAAYKSKGEFKKALEDVTEGLRLDPNDATALVMRGALHGLVGQFDEAIRDYREAIRIDPKHDEAYNDLAWLRATCLIASARDGKDAVEAATRACELTDWRRWDYLDTLAAAFAEAGDFEQAVKYQRQIMSKNTLAEEARIGVQHGLELYQEQKPYHAALTRQDFGVSSCSPVRCGGKHKPVHQKPP